MQLIFQENIFIKNHICKMKKVLICATWMALMFTSCSKNMDFSAPSDQPIKHAESVFGVQFDSNCISHTDNDLYRFIFDVFAFCRGYIRWHKPRHDKLLSGAILLP